MKIAIFLLPPTLRRHPPDHFTVSTGSAGAIKYYVYAALCTIVSNKVGVARGGKAASWLANCQFGRCLNRCCCRLYCSLPYNNVKGSRILNYSKCVENERKEMALQGPAAGPTVH